MSRDWRSVPPGAEEVMIEVYKIMMATDRVYCRKPFSMSEVDKTRGHSFRVKRKRFRGL